LQIVIEESNLEIQIIAAIIAATIIATLVTVVALKAVDGLPCSTDPVICAQAKGNSIFIIATADAAGGIGTFATVKRLLGTG
jgi:hypothetical protein